MYICANVDQNTLDCLEWVQSTGLLPPLSVENAYEIGLATLGVWAVAYGAGVLIRFMWQQVKPGEDNHYD